MINQNQNTEVLPIKGLTVKKIAGLVNGKYYGPKDVLNLEISGISNDSKSAKKGNLFAAFAGEKSDGNIYIPNAFENGAIAALTQKKQTNKKYAYILVDSVLEAMQKIASYYRLTLNIPIVAIIGSVGKTSTKEAISNVLSQNFCVQKTKGNLNNQLGLPISILSIKEPHEVAVLEMGISDFGQMTKLAKIARPDILVFTNVGSCHLKFLGDKAGVLKAKSEAFDYLHDKNSVVILNGDDEYLGKIADINGKKPIKFGIRTDSDNYVCDLTNKGLAGTDGMLHLGAELQAKFSLPLPGIHSVSNMLAAASVGHYLGMSIDDIVAGVSRSKNLSGHGQIISSPKYTILDEAYNANPESMKASLDLLETANTRKVAILGDMFELGENEKELHYQLGQYIASKKLDVLVAIGKLGKNIYSGFIDAIDINKNADEKNTIEHAKLDVYYFKTVDEFLNAKIDILKNDDSILVKASNGMKFSKIVDSLKA